MFFDFSLWNGAPEYIGAPVRQEEDTVEQLIKDGGCSKDEAEEIASALDEGIAVDELLDYNVIDEGVELIEPTPSFVDKFIQLLKELDYEFEIFSYKIKDLAFKDREKTVVRITW